MIVAAAVACSLWFTIPTVSRASYNAGCCGVDSSHSAGVTQFQVWGVRQWRYWLGESKPADTLLDYGPITPGSDGQNWWVRFTVPSGYCYSAWVLAGNSAGFSCESPFILLNEGDFVEPPWRVNLSGPALIGPKPP